MFGSQFRSGHSSHSSGRGGRFLVLLLGLVASVVSGLFAGPAMAHPHIWIDARVALIFDDNGALTAIRHDWTFDEAFSAWAVTGLDVNGDGTVSPDELTELAADYVGGLGEYDFFTFAGEGDRDYALTPNGIPDMSYEDGRVRMLMTLDLPEPHVIGDAFEIAVMDPEWYVALTLMETDPVSLINAPSVCAATIAEPVRVSAEVEQRLLSIGPDVTQLPSDLRAQLREAGERVQVRCGGTPPVAENAMDAIEQATSGPRSAPFEAPPTEVGLPVPRTGFFGWIYEVQRSFYQSLTRALGDLKTDANAFWVLGTLSFLYGIFHAAGPGHGKVVISSYVLATEQQVSRGIWMSFASAMVQALVAVVFVSVLALAFDLTSQAMSDAAMWMTIASYALVVLMGLWLVARKLFGFGHHHHHDHEHAHDDHDHAAHDHHDDHAHHHHVVTPEQTGGSLRDALGVILAVGMRPCSGALVVLVFALSQGIFIAGIAATFLMGIGTALTVSLLASLALVIKQGSLSLSGGRASAMAGHVIWWLELLGAFAVLGFGVILLIASF